MTRAWIAVFAAALWLPFVVIVVKPSDYALYMFFPATPHSAFDRFRLLAANALIIVAAAGGVLSSLSLTFIGIRLRRWTYLLAPLIVALHPILQPVYFESLDTDANYRWYARAKEGRIIGMNPAQVRALLGEPTSQWTQETSRWEGKVLPGYTAWEYQPLPFYLFGSRLQVFFENGRVRNIEANDD